MVDQPVRERLAGADQGVRHRGQLHRGGRRADDAVQQRGDDLDHPSAHRLNLAGERFLAARLPVQHGPAVPVRADEVEERPQPVEQLLVGGHAGLHDRGDGLHQPGGFAMQAGDEQVLLGAEVGVHHGLGHPGPFRDLVHGRVVEPAPREHGDGGVEHLLFTHGSR